MKIGIIAAMEQELVLLVEQLENKVEETILGNTYYTGRLGKHDVVLVQSGVGKVMSAMSVAVLADHFEVEALINTGSAGAVAPGLKIGDVVVASKLAYHDVDLTAFGYDYGQMSMQPLYFESDASFVTTFEKVLLKRQLTVRLVLSLPVIALLLVRTRLMPLRGISQRFWLLKWKGRLLLRQLTVSRNLLSLCVP